jgi:hypothetical protein
MNTAIAETTAQESNLAVFEPDTLIKLSRIGDMMAGGKTTVPQHLQGNPSDCTAIAMQAYQWQMNPYAVAQKTHLVNGRLGYEAQLVVAVINSRAPVCERLRYDWEGDWNGVNGKTDKEEKRACTVSCRFVGEAEPRKLRVSMAQVGVRNSPLWVDDPRQQLAYLTAKRWARLHCPDVLLGVYTPDELQEFIPVREQATATSSSAIVRDHDTAEDAIIVDTTAGDQQEPEFNVDAAIEHFTQMIGEAATLADLKKLELPIQTTFADHKDAMTTVVSMYNARAKELREARAAQLRAEDAAKLQENAE